MIMNHRTSRFGKTLNPHQFLYFWVELKTWKVCTNVYERTLVEFSDDTTMAGDSVNELKEDPLRTVLPAQLHRKMAFTAKSLQ